MLCADRRCVVCVIAVGIALGGGARNAEGWFQDSRQGNAVNEARGQAALAEARQHMADNRWRLAIGAYETALTYLPGNAEALAGIRTAQAELNQAPIISPVEQELSVQLGRAQRRSGPGRRTGDAQLFSRRFSPRSARCAERLTYRQSGFPPGPSRR